MTYSMDYLIWRRHVSDSDVYKVYSGYELTDKVRVTELTHWQLVDDVSSVVKL